MPRPGTEVVIVDGSPPGSLALDTGTAFMVGKSERGSVTAAEHVASMTQYRSVLGSRAGGSLLYDSASAFFGEGGGSLYVGRVLGAGAAAATNAFGTLTADAASPGVWGNGLKLDMVAPATLAEEMRAGTFADGTPAVLTVTLDGTVVERSPVVSTGAALMDWSQGSDFVRLAEGTGTDLPASGTTATLAGGADGSASGASDVADALARFDHAFGPGQVLAPGMTTTAVQEAVLAHCAETYRCALLDCPDDPDPLALTAAIGPLQTVEGIRYASAWAPWAIYPADVSPATVVVPYSAVEAGIIARVDRAGNPNAPAAGTDGIARLAVGLSQTYTDAQREALNSFGIDLAKPVYGDIRSYGYRTAAGPSDPNWMWFGNSRTLMAIAYECDAVGESYVLKQIDGRGHLFSRLNKDLGAICARYYDMGALYGETAADAFVIDTGPGVNTIDTIKNGEVHAVVKVKCSPAGEWVVIEIVKVPVERPIAA